jgi:tetratricopeptide (TPR) repeat protein
LRTLNPSSMIAPKTMGFIQNLFRKKKKTSASQKQKPVPGDFFYLQGKGQYSVFRLLEEDQQAGIYHLTIFTDTSDLPQDPTLLKATILHVPIDSAAFADAVVFAREPLKEKDFYGYHEYLKQTDFNGYVKATGQNIAELIATAKLFYVEGYRLSKNGFHQEAINAYSRALDLLPTFFEALDNRAISKMDMGQYEEAVQDLQHSLKGNPENHVAAFALGECYLQLGLPDPAREMYAYVLSLSPGHAKSEKRMQLLSGEN